ncbi:MAG: pseudaminic acid biosynthesis-associated methylase [Saprospiraceae bacterium]|nr:pseudaminic acid biosynthesis-associated methylase [Saprospiraceae bacterium]
MNNFKTDQETFWAGEFGDQYINRNTGEKLLASNIHLFSKALKNAGKVSSLIEFGANIGMNLKALKILYPDCLLKGIEINRQAAAELEEVIGSENVINDSIYHIQLPETFDVVLIKGVMIHLHPDMLKLTYQKLYEHAAKYILIAEYYNPVPVEINYRGHKDRLYKRDFAGEFLETYKDCELVDYGFVYRRDPAFPQDDVTWFLIKK